MVWPSRVSVPFTHSSPNKRARNRVPSGCSRTKGLGLARAALSAQDPCHKQKLIFSSTWAPLVAYVQDCFAKTDTIFDRIDTSWPRRRSSKAEASASAGSTTLTWILSYGRPATLNEVATNPSVVVSGHRKDVSGLAQRRRGHAYAAILWHDSVR